MFEACSYIGSGRIHFESAQKMKKRRVPYHRILYMESGQGRFIFGEKHALMSQGHIYLLAPGERQVNYSGKTVVTYEYIEFDYPDALITTPYKLCHIPPPLKNALVETMRSLKLVDGKLRRHLLAAIIGLALYDSSTTLISEPRLRRVLSFINEQPGASITIAALAKIAGISQSQLRRLFHAHLNCTPKHYLMRVRMEYARNLLQAEGLRVKEVAALLNFPSPFQFSALYHKVHQVSPSHDITRMDTDAWRVRI